MVKPFCPDGRDVAQTTLHLVGRGQGSQKRSTALFGILRGSQHRANIIAGMTRLPPGQITVIKVKIPNQCGVIKGGTVGCRLSAPDEGTVPGAIERFNLVPNQGKGFPFQSPDSATQSVQHSDLELMTGFP
jgi:hypothetical protein